MAGAISRISGIHREASPGRTAQRLSHGGIGKAPGMQMTKMTPVNIRMLAVIEMNIPNSAAAGSRKRQPMGVVIRMRGRLRAAGGAGEGPNST